MHEPRVSGAEITLHRGVAKDTAYRLIECRGLPAHRVGRLWNDHGVGVERGETVEIVRADHGFFEEG